MTRIPNYNTVADIIDRLIVEVLKLSTFENNKRIESLKENPDLELIVHWDRQSRNACEYRDMLKRELDRVLAEVIANQEYITLPATRTFLAPPRSVSEVLTDMIYASKESLREELARALENVKK